MVVLAIARVLIALVGAALVFPWVIRRWILFVLLCGTIVYVGLPIQADQDVFWTSGYTIAAQLGSAYAQVANAANRVLACIEPAREMWNRVAAVVQAVLMVFTDTVMMGLLGPAALAAGALGAASYNLSLHCPALASSIALPLRVVLCAGRRPIQNVLGHP